MLDRLARRIYSRLGRRYKLVFILTEEPAALLIATLAIVLLTSYYGPSGSQLLVMLAGAWIATAAAVAYALWRGEPFLERVVAWRLLHRDSSHCRAVRRRSCGSRLGGLRGSRLSHRSRPTFVCETEYGRNKEKRRNCGTDKATNNGAAQRRILLGAQRHGRHTDNHGQRRHQHWPEPGITCIQGGG